VFSLPMYPELTPQQIGQICEALRVLAHGKKRAFSRTGKSARSRARVKARVFAHG